MLCACCKTPFGDPAYLIISPCECVGVKKYIHIDCINGSCSDCKFKYIIKPQSNANRSKIKLSWKRWLCGFATLVVLWIGVVFYTVDDPFNCQNFWDDSRAEEFLFLCAILTVVYVALALPPPRSDPAWRQYCKNSKIKEIV
ncbi:MAG: hypothetical protein Harvfovirus19_13 [Harvfovirus sp.]|uniref:RING-CH-type domain-containing protein n=1 Tax=Harvfovirus sp. TaxID=2487768 RepID=A0A3G5A1S1_9VIRU|nr:MAG: hypothetical protein Harvfovirus19_13 [Harvfovirus sp.]